MFNRSLFKSLAVGLLAGTSVVAVSHGLADTSRTNKDMVQDVRYIAQPAAVSNLADMVEEVSPAVVQVISKGKVRSNVVQEFDELPDGMRDPFEEFFRQFRGGERFRQPDRRFQPQQPAAIGSGFIVEGDGIVITNNHVVDNAETVTVRLNDGRELTAKVLGTDPKTDLAVLKIEADEKFDTVKWGDSDKARVGDSVFAVGSPFGLYGSVTSGIVSARGREIGSGPYDDFIQTDTPINKGNSGGPLFNEDGEVIGVNTAIYSPGGGNVGIGFSIPSDMAQSIVDDLIDDGVVERGWMGISIQPVTDDIAESLGLEKAHGALVAEVVDDGPAEEAGLKPGDVIIAFDGNEIEDLKDLTKLVAKAKADSTVDVDIWRNSDKETKKVNIGAFEDDTKVTRASFRGDGDEVPHLGLALNQKLEVVEIDPNSPTAQTNIRVGDKIESVNNEPVESLSDVQDELAKAAAENKEAVLLRVKNRQGKRFVAVPFDRA